MQCPKCKHNNREGAKFCEECGEKLQLKCPKCGAELRANAKFCDECGANLIAEIQTDSHKTNIPKLEDMHAQLQSLIPEALAQKYLSAEQMATGENRPITALFADISGFTPLSANKSSEAIFQLVQDCFKRLVSIVAKYEGSISGFRGDGLLALFGAPILHENDAERAILSAIDMRNAMQDYQLQVSIGINTAMMTVGEIQTQLHNEYTAYGMDINLAKRLQEHAEAGQILVGSGTYRLTRKAFDFEMIPNLSVKGFSQPVTAYSVKQVKVHPEKLRGIEGLRARMIGREHEFADAKESVDEWLSGHGQIVNIIGEAGIGKSRLVSELKAYISGKDDDLQYIEGRCVSIGQPISYWPFIDILKTYFNLSEGDDSSTIAGKVTESITQLMPLSADETLSLLGQLLSIKYGNELDDRLKFATPEQIRHQTLMRLRDIFTTLARQKPLLLILEDLHWSDDLSLDLISLLMDELVNTPLMLLCVYRPEKEHRVWQLSDQARRKCMDRFTEIMLKPLSSVESRQLIESLLEIENLPESIKKMIMEKSEGNPFFIEEVIRSLIEQGMIYHEDDRWKAREEIADIDVPDTIQSVILSRVDRLQAEAKYVLQCASVIGRLFKHRLLEHLTHQEQKLNHYISEFEERELVYEERTVPELEYAFKHALTQEATYQSILERKRREFHLHVAQGIEKLYQERIEEYYEELAEHYSKSDDEEKAINYLLKSGIKLARQFSNDEALRYFNKAEEMITKSDKPYRHERAILYENRGSVLGFICQWTKAISDYEEALKWCDDPHGRAEIYGKMGWLECEGIQDKVKATEYFELGLKELPENDSSIQLVELERGIAWAWQRGLLEDNFIRCQHATEIAERMGYKRELALLYSDMEKWQSFNGIYSDEYGDKAIRVAEELGDLPTLLWVYYNRAGTRLWVRTGKHWTEESIGYFIKSLEISERIGDLRVQATTLCTLGEAYHELGQNDNAIKAYEEALDIVAETKAVVPLLLCGRITELYAKAGRRDTIIPAFIRIMRVLASLEIDEISQARSIFLNSKEEGADKIFRSFRRAFCMVNEEKDFAYTAISILEDLLKEVTTKVQIAWYHIQLMSLNIEIGNIHCAKEHAEQVVLIADEMGRPNHMVRFFPAYLFLGKTDIANDMVYKTLLDYIKYTSIVLRMIEPSYHELGCIEAFDKLCDRFELEYSEELKRVGINQIRLKPAEYPANPSKIDLQEHFDTSAFLLNCKWLDPEGISSYSLNLDHDCVEIRASGGSGFGHYKYSAPRFSQSITSDFIIEARMGGARSGGLFIQSGNNVITIQQVLGLKNCISLSHRRRTVCSGFLDAESLILALERKNNIIRGYCSSDGQNWYTCGWTEADMVDPVETGIFASCLGQSILEQTITSFDHIRIYRQK